MSKVSITGNASGSATFTIAAPATNTDRTLTLPDNSGTVITTASTGGVSQDMLASGVAGNGPAFSAYITSNQTLTSNVWTKIQCNAESFDTANCFNTSTHRFTPNVAGYYQINLDLRSGAGTVRAAGAAIYKNGAVFVSQIFFVNSETYGDDISISLPKLVYMNGTTDYIEAYGYVFDAVAGTDVIVGGAEYFWFEGYLARAA